jgi:hypothetical protein
MTTNQINQQQQQQFHVQNDSMIQQQQQQQQQSQRPQQQQSQQQQQFSCVYTKQLTQKRKKWHDGRLIVRQGRAVLHDANPAVGAGDPTLDECELSGIQFSAVLQGLETRLQTGNHIIEIQGPWRTSMMTTSNSNAGVTKPLVSIGMKKLLGQKFRKVTAGKYIPPPPQQQNQQQHQPAWRKRSLPLQPGELQQRHYGNQQQAPQAPNWNQPPANAGYNNQPRNNNTPVVASSGWNQPPPPNNNTAVVHPPQTGGWNQDPRHHQQQQHPQNHPQSWNPSSQSLPTAQLRPGPPSVPGGSRQNQHHMHSHALNTTAQHQHQQQQQNNALHTAPHFSRPANNHHQHEESAADKDKDKDKENGNANRANNPFAANAFNPVSFYGEEGDDEDNTGDTPDQFNWDDDQSEGAEPALLEQPALLNNHSKETTPARATSSQSLEQAACASNFAANEAIAPGEQACTSNATANEAPAPGDGALSTLELLQLFGAGNNLATTMAVTETSSQSQQQPEAKGDDDTTHQVKDTTSNLARTTAVTGASSQSQQQQKAKGDDDTSTQEKDTTNDFQFALPPASDSSSDDEDD